jgi:hypothetical protein
MSVDADAELSAQRRLVRDTQLRRVRDTAIAEASAQAPAEAARRLTAMLDAARQELTNAERNWGRTLMPYKVHIDRLVNEFPELPTVCNEENFDKDFWCGLSAERGEQVKDGSYAIWHMATADQIVRPHVPVAGLTSWRDSFRWAARQKATGVPFDPASIVSTTTLRAIRAQDIADAREDVSVIAQWLDVAQRAAASNHAELSALARSARDTQLRQDRDRAIAAAEALQLTQRVAPLNRLVAAAQQELADAERGWGRTLMPYKVHIDRLVNEVPELSTACNDNDFWCGMAADVGRAAKATWAIWNFATADRILRPEVPVEGLTSWRDSFRWAARQKATGVPFNPASIMSAATLSQARAQDIADARADLELLTQRRDAVNRELQIIADEAERVRREAEERARQIAEEARRQEAIALQAQREAAAAQALADRRAEELRVAEAERVAQQEAERRRAVAEQAQRDADEAERRAREEIAAAREKEDAAREALAEAAEAKEEADLTKEDVDKAKGDSAAADASASSMSSSTTLLIGAGLLIAALWARK